MKKIPQPHRFRLPLVLLTLALTTSAFAQEAPAKLPTPPEVWKDYDPDAGDFKEEIISEETKGGIYFKDSYITAYVNGEEVRVFCKYGVKEGAKNAPGLLNVHGWTQGPYLDLDYIKETWVIPTLRPINPVLIDLRSRRGETQKREHGCQGGLPREGQAPGWKGHHRSEANG